MVLLGGLEIVAAGYLIRQHQKNKKERSLLEEESYQLQDDGSHRHSRRRHSHERRSSHDRRHSRERRHSRDRRHGRSHSYDGDDKHGRYRSESQERRRRKEKEEYVPRPGRGRENSAPPVQAPLAVPVNGPGRQNSAPPSQRPAQMQRPPPSQPPPAGYPPTGWPANWSQSRTPDPAASTAQPQAQAPPAVGNHGHPADVKYGFDPSIPHNQYPQPPPAYQPYAASSQQNLAPPQASGSGSREERRHRRRARSDSRRSVSPNLGLYDEERERLNPSPRVRFAVDERSLQGSERGSIVSPPPEYRA
jgi:hypothetical protein